MNSIHSACVLSKNDAAILLRRDSPGNSGNVICQVIHVHNGVASLGVERSGEAVKLCRLSEASDCVSMLSMNGEVEIFDPTGRSLGSEDVTGCLAQGAPLPKYGYLLSMALIGGKLYACGMGGQVHMRHSAGQWRLISQELCTESSYDRYFANIQGRDDDQIVVDGLDGELYVYNGQAWRRVNSGTQAAIGEMAFLSNDDIYITSVNSTLLQGNFKIGFQPMRIGNVDRAFLKICNYNGCLYIGSYDGLFRYDISAGNLVKIIVSQDIKDSEIVSLQSYERELWCFTVHAVYVFDGSSWRKFFSL